MENGSAGLRAGTAVQVAAEFLAAEVSIRFTRIEEFDEVLAFIAQSN
jgi:hypothetical protein